MVKETNPLSRYYRAIAKYYRIISIMGVLAILSVLVKLLIKGVNNIDKIDLFLDYLFEIIVYTACLVAVTVIRKKYKE